MKSWNAWLVITLIGLGIFTTVGKSLAWEFSMDGQFNWEYDLRGQTGSNGFFGPYDVDAGSGATYTPGTVTPVLVPGSSQAPTIMNSVVQNAITPGTATAYGAGYFAPLNFWMGFNLPGNDQNLTTSGSSFASGSNGSWNTVYMDTLMDLHLQQGLKSSRTLPCGSVANTWNLYITRRNLSPHSISPTTPMAYSAQFLPVTGTHSG